MQRYVKIKWIGMTYDDKSNNKNSNHLCAFLPRTLVDENENSPQGD